MKIAVISCHTSSLIWFRMDMMKAFIKSGHTVIAIGPEPVENWHDEFKKISIEYRQVFVERNGLNLINDMRTCRELYKFMKLEKPDKVFVYQAKTIIYSSIAARLNGITGVYPLIAGLGSIFRGEGFKNKILRIILSFEYWIAIKCSEKVFFQNSDDRNVFIQKGIIKKEKTIIINGSGVNLDRFKLVPIPEEPGFLFIGRLLKDKGIIEYLESCEKVKQNHPNVRCLLVGPFDKNPSALKPSELQCYIDSGTIEYFGEQVDVRPFIALCSTYILPSYHEGIPKTVLEAMAMGRSIITTNAPGCRETVIEGVNGFLVDVKDIQGLVEKMEYLICNPNKNQAMGIASLKIATEKYDVNAINRVIIETMGLT